MGRYYPRGNATPQDQNAAIDVTLKTHTPPGHPNSIQDIFRMPGGISPIQGELRAQILRAMKNPKPGGTTSSEPFFVENRYANEA